MNEFGGPPIRSRSVVFAERLIFLLIAGLFFWLVWLWPQVRSLAPFFEHGILENLQLGILAVCAIILIFMVRLSHGVTRTISVIFLIVVVTGMLREADVKTIPGP